MNTFATRTSGRRFVGWPFSTTSLLDELLTYQPPGSQVVWSALPTPVHVAQDDDGASISIDMPGVGPEDVDLTFADGTLEVVGKRGEHTYRHRFALGETIDANTIQASLDKGVLAIRAHKRAEAKPRKIAVQMGSPAGKTLDAGK